MIGRLITIITFPGVIVHEIAHQFFCKLAKTAVLEVKYFQFGNHAGYVVHEKPQKLYQDLMIGLGPFLFNTIIGALIAFPAAVPTLTFDENRPVDLVLIWVGVSIAMHAFPSTGDAKSMWRSIMTPAVGLGYKILIVPVVGLIYLGALGSMFWLDLVYGIAVILILPTLLVGF
jgi:hypothetical protein